MLNLHHFPGEDGPQTVWERGFEVEIMDWVVFDNYCYLLGLPPISACVFSEGGEGTVSGLCHVGFPLFGFQGINYLQ